ncbi:MAG TPA: ABC transporter permease [Phycisphaerae bacterium]|nr:ABC transporter permease [Phycisphaerae bacterium]
MVPIARRNLFHNKVKLATAAVGVAFSTVLVTCLGGLFVGTSRQATGIIDHAGADLWVAAPGTRSIGLGEPISERRLYQAMSVPGVLWAEPVVLQFSSWRLRDGRQEVTQIVGLVPHSRLNLPWDMAMGTRGHMLHDDGVIIDERERKRFGSEERPLEVDDRVEILNVRARVAGFSRGVGSITTIPYVFTTQKQAQRYTTVDEGQTSYIAVKAASGIEVARLQRELEYHIPEVDVLTAEQFSERTRDYWVFGTGLGLGIIFAAGLGLVVGSVVVSQTIYAATLERLAEYGTLKALGMSNQRLAFIIIEQALWIGGFGFAAGAACAATLGACMPGWHLPVEIPAWLYGLMLLLTSAMCTGASVTSVIKVFRLPPAVVFRG